MANIKSAEKRDVSSKQITETEHATAATKTKKLRALRLAKEGANVAICARRKARADAA